MLPSHLLAKGFVCVKVLSIYRGLFAQSFKRYTRDTPGFMTISDGISSKTTTRWHHSSPAFFCISPAVESISTPLFLDQVYTLSKIKLNEPGNPTFIGLHRKCLVKSVKHIRWGNYLFTGQGCLVECIAHIKYFNKGNTGLKIRYCMLLPSPGISLNYVKLYLTAF